MNNVPPSVRAALKRRGQDAILQQEGDYQTFKPQIDAILHSDQNINMSDDVMIPDYEEDLSPEEQKATDRIEELGSKYSVGGSNNNQKYTSEELEEKFGLSESDVADMAIEQIGEKRIEQLTKKYKLGSSNYLSANQILKSMSEKEIREMLENNGLINEDEYEGSPMKEFSGPEGSDLSYAQLENTPAGMPPFHWEQPDDPEKEPHIVIDEGPHKGERYDNPDDYKNSNKADDELENIRKSNPNGVFERRSWRSTAEDKNMNLAMEIAKDLNIDRSDVYEIANIARALGLGRSESEIKAMYREKDNNLLNENLSKENPRYQQDWKYRPHGVLFGKERAKMEQLVSDLQKAGFKDVQLQDGWEDDDNGRRWTAPVFDGKWLFNDLDWVGFMNGEISTQDFIDNLKLIEERKKKE